MALWGLINASLVGIDFFIIAYGVYLAKVKRDFVRHPKVMITAGIVFLVFLASFLAKVLTQGIQPFPDWTLPGTGITAKHILWVHEGVALVTVPLVALAYWYAYRKQFAKHKKIVRYAWPLWLFESLFGIIEFVILYHT